MYQERFLPIQTLLGEYNKTETQKQSKVPKALFVVLGFEIN